MRVGYSFVCVRVRVQCGFRVRVGVRRPGDSQPKGCQEDKR